MIHKVQCKCGKIQLSLVGEPKVRAYCHCSDCRDLLSIPFHSVTAWDSNNVSIVRAQKDL